MKVSVARGRVFTVKGQSARLVLVLPETEKPVRILPVTVNPVRNVLTASAQSVLTARSEANLNVTPESIPVINSKSIVSNMRIRQNRSVSINTSLMQVSVPVARQMILSRQV